MTLAKSISSYVNFSALNLRTLSILLVLLSGITSCQQQKAEQSDGFFQGELHYHYSYQSDVHNLAYLKSIRPKISVFRFDSNNYQSTFYGADTISYYYNSHKNVAISSKNMIFEPDCQDYSINPEQRLSSKVYDTDELVMGYPCKVIEFETTNGFYRYHVSTEIFLPPPTYQNHLAYNWAFYGKQAKGGIILRMETRFRDFTMIGEITKIGWYRNGQKAWTISEKLLDQACK